jgi:apolipoprotein N-acyltransferase
MGWAVVSGVLTALAFPKFSLAFLAWVSLVPLFFCLSHQRVGSGFWRAFVAGLFFYGVLLYWIPDVPRHYASMPLGLCLLIDLALVAFLSLYWGLFGAVFVRVRRAFPTGAFFLAPFFWVGGEYLATRLCTGFPWGILGTSQFENLPFIQVASLAGVYGLSFILVFLQSTFVLAVSQKKRSPFFAALGLLLLAHAWGAYELRRANFDGPTKIQAAVIQGNVSSDVYWDFTPPEVVRRLFKRHMDLTRRAVDAGSGLVIWPEFTVPLCFSCDDQLYRSMALDLENYVRRSGVTLLLGTNETTGPPGDRRYYNTAMALHPDLGRSLYFKMHLVPFGEYTPYKKVFFFIERLTHAIGEITPGTAPVLHDYRGFLFASPICYEIVFPGLVRTFVRRGASFLVTITNDGWYGRSSAPYQHWAQAVLRAVENRRYLLRAATTGISGAVDPFGRVMARSNLMTEAMLTEKIAPSQRLSLYTKAGDVLPVAGLTLGALSAILALVRNRKDRHRHERHRPLL